MRVALITIPVITSIACAEKNTVIELNSVESKKIQLLLTKQGTHSVSALLQQGDRAVCVLGQAGGYSKIDRYGYLQKIEQLKIPWVHGFLAEIGATTDWYWTLVLFDEKDVPRVMKIDRGGVADLLRAPKELCYGPQDTYSVQIISAGKKEPAFVSFE